MKWPRFVHRIYADLAGYFWLPCPLCGRRFGGHEWLPNDTLWLPPSMGQGVCPNCGDLAREQNAKLARIRELESACREADHVLEQVQLVFLPNSHNVRVARKAITEALLDSSPTIAFSQADFDEIYNGDYFHAMELEKKL